jgi:type I restriction enzyme, S subunit
LKQVLKARKGYNLKEWYFDKKIGIPEDWEIIPLQDVLLKQNSGLHNKLSETISGDKIVQMTDLYTYDIIGNEKFTLAEFPKEIKGKKVNKEKYFLKENDFIYIEISLVREGVGKTVIVSKDAEQTYFAGNLRRFTIKESLNHKFLFYYLNSEWARNYMIGHSYTAAQTGITIKDYFKIKILAPKKVKEQEKIATIISNLDDLITSTDKIIIQINSLKQGLMQKLLTVGINHKKFKKIPWLFQKDIHIPNEWEVKKINDVFDFLISGTNARSDLNETSEIRYIHYGDIHTKWNLSLDCDIEKIPRIDIEKIKNLPLLKEGDLIIADASEDFAGSGSSVLLKNVKDKKIVAGLHTIVLRIKDNEISPDFVKYLTSINSVKIQIISYVTGSKVYGLGKTPCKQIKVPFPKFPEQQKIAEILSDLDEQIITQTKYQEKLKKLKKSLIQKLLTGEIRV